MRNSYVGIVDRGGLVMFIPEHPHTERFLLRRSLREDSVCFWVVIDDAPARAVRTELVHGDRMNALRLLQQRAEDIGTILPPEPCPNFLDDTA